MLTDEIARQLATTVTSGLKTLNDTDPKATWTLIFSELFKSLKENGVIEVKELETLSVSSITLVSPPTGGPVTGAVTAPSTVSLKGKIT